MKETILFILLSVALSSSSQNVVTLSQSITKEPIIGRNGLYLRPSFCIGLQNPFVMNPIQFGLSWGGSILFRYDQKKWIGFGMINSQFKMYYNGHHAGNATSFIPYMELRRNFHSFGNNSLYAGILVGANLSGWNGETTHEEWYSNDQGTIIGIVYYTESLSPFFAIDFGTQFKQLDIGIHFESSFARVRPYYETQTHTIWMYNVMLNVAYNFRIIKLP